MNTSTAFYSLLLPLLVACRGPTMPSDRALFVRTAITNSAAATALACGTAHGLRPERTYASLTLFVTPTLENLDGHVRADWVQGRAIVVPAVLADEPRVWAHALLHALFNLPGSGANHPAIFTTCGLWPI